MTELDAVKANLQQEASTARDMAEGPDRRAAAIVMASVGGKRVILSARASGDLTVDDVKAFLDGLDGAREWLLSLKRKLQPR